MMMMKISNELISNRITHTYPSGRGSATLTIPIKIARKYGFDKPTDIIIEDMKDGIFIKKFVFPAGEKMED